MQATEEDRPNECVLISAKNYCVVNCEKDYYPKLKAKGVSFLSENCSYPK